ncbi:flagellar brake protein [Fictibacillus iocasae]|uniref:Flagellar brake protein n=1 Tax=Fictibacillus iocasae TaxID=2715437 RepID=A0ABW2NMR6_9BACL
MIAVGNTLYLESTTPEKPGKYRCKVMDILEESIAVDYPINEKTNRTEFFGNGTEFAASFVGSDKNVYQFHSELIGRKVENIPLMVMSWPGEGSVVKIQRREYVRVEVLLNVSILKNEEQLDPFTSTALDISGGGMLLSLPEQHGLQENMDISCRLQLPMQSGEVKSVEIPCKVIRLMPGIQQGKERASVMYVNITDHDQSVIMRYCFEQQLLARRKDG